MADKKISALTGATTPLAGTEVLPIVQGGATVKVAVANLTAGRAIDVTNVIATGYAAVANGTSALAYIGKGSDLVSGAGANDTSIRWDGVSGNLLFAANSTKVASFDVTGNLVPATAAKGINFTANTPTAGMTSQLLNWYEEGTWTPVDDGVSSGVLGTWSVVAGSAKYTRVGRLVTAEVSYSGVAIGLTAAVGYYRWRGLPFNQVGILLGTWASGDLVYANIGGTIVNGGTDKYWIDSSRVSTTCTSIIVQMTYTV